MSGEGCIKVHNYCSDSSEFNSIVRQRKNKDKQWQKEIVFPDKPFAENFIKSETSWSYSTNYTDSTGCLNVYYRCNKVKFRGPQCNSGMRLVYNSQNSEVTLYRSSLPHNHNELSNLSKHKLSDATKTEIKRLFENGIRMKPEKILECLADKGFKLPTKIQLNNYLLSLRKEKFGQANISLGELEKRILEHVIVPEDDSEPFIVTYEICYDKKEFRFFMSSKKLLQHALLYEHIHADATSKLNWHGFPVLVIGTSDRHRSFHCFGIAVCSSENTEDFRFVFSSLKNNVTKILEKDVHFNILISGAAGVIGNAFRSVFGDECIIKMCWFDMKKCVEKKLKLIVKDKDTQVKLLKDIENLQLCKTEELFNTAAELFLNKWRLHESDFIKYFERKWLFMNKNWFEAVCSKVPSTNNCLEAFNRTMKAEVTFRERLPISRFFSVLLECIEQWSLNYINKIKIVYDSPLIELELWTKSYIWARQNKEINKSLTDEESRVALFEIPARNLTEIRYGAGDATIVSLDKFFEDMFSKYNVKMVGNNYLDATCDCPAFLKKYMCKHVIGLAIRLKLADPPVEAKNIPLDGKRKRGRPAKAKKALIVQ